MGEKRLWPDQRPRAEACAVARRRPVAGPSIFDLQLVAAMLAYDLRTVYTYNRVDFEAFPEVTVRTPGGNE